jgi:hypothetical protein
LIRDVIRKQTDAVHDLGRWWGGRWVGKSGAAGMRSRVVRT